MKLYTTHGDYKIYLDSEEESGDRFYCRMGRFFADRQIAKELAEPLYNGPSHHWLLAMNKEGAVCAFGCLDASKVEAKGEALITYGYVMPEHRQKGLHTAIFRARLTLADELGAAILRGVANGNSRRTFETNGFEVASQRGQYTYFRKEIIREEPV